MTTKPASDNQLSHVAKENAAVVYEVFLAETAAAAYGRYFEKAQNAIDRGNLDSSHCTTLRQIDEALEKIIPRDPFNKDYALIGDLRRIFRLQKGRLRICWIGSSEARVVHVLFIAETLRKAGDAHDPYRDLSRMVQAGAFNHVFAKLGVKLPPLAPNATLQ